ncbi:MAG: ribosome-associated translation inhibitor RaiA [Phycisphaerae bacterium]|jgi:putative sigma-54 modulation protein|nr:ribosome-associated translation inhibitor RaiA [Phycisphaerae bacterium]MCZ2400716.1 ribosome-associated translation inhibitor RaiA [Phycisphaerae bacterium]NUQ48641.1 ribosome-associated translation inhibitor RaiA [Phycisphaerae bacterium]
MQITVSGRHMTVSDEVKSYCQDKAGRLLRFYDRIQSIELVLGGADGQHSAEIIVHAEGTHPFVASEQHDDVHAAIDVLMDKVEGQIRRHKERLRNRKHP